MIEDAELPRIVGALPVLRHATPEQLRALQVRGSLARIPAGRDVFVEGQQVGAIPLLLSGTVRVYQIGETGLKDEPVSATELAELISAAPPPPVE